MTMLLLVFVAGLLTGVAIGGAYTASLRAKVRLYEKYIEGRLGGSLPLLDADSPDVPWKASSGKERHGLH